MDDVTISNYGLTNSPYERLSNLGLNKESLDHIHRYEIAGRYTTESDKVLDMACGIGYGAKFMKGEYIGVDKENLCGNIVADLNTWQPDFDFDIGISFETIEHIENYQNLLNILKKAKKYIIYSTPIVPTKHRNIYHLHDFTFKQLKEFFKDIGDIIYEEKQTHPEYPDGLYGIIVVRVWTKK